MKSIIKAELDRSLTKSSVTGFLIFLVIAISVMQFGIARFQTGLKKEKEFIEVERKKINRYINYTQYGIYGFRILYKPSPLSVIHSNSTTFREIEAFIDTGVRLRFSEPLIGAGLFSRAPRSNMDLSWFVLLFGSAFSITWGFFAFRNRNYLRFLRNFYKEKSIFLGILAGRGFVLSAACLLSNLIVIVLLLLNDINLTFKELIGLMLFYLVALIVLLFFLVVGSFIGAIEGKTNPIVIMVLFWFAVVLVLPELLNTVFEVKAESVIKSRYNFELEKTDLLMKFEAFALKEARDKRYKTKDEKLESDKRMGEMYWNNEFKRLEAFDKIFYFQTDAVISNYHLWSIFSPVSMYTSTNNELSSKGYNAYMDIYSRCLGYQKKFLRYYLNKRFYEKYSKVESFLPSGKNIFQGKISIPKFFFAGVLLNLLYLVIALAGAYFNLLRMIYPATEKGVSFTNTRFSFKTGSYINISSDCKNLKNQVINVMYGRGKDFDGEILIDQDDVSLGIKDVFFIPDILSIPPYIRTKTLSVMGGVKQAQPMKLNASRFRNISNCKRVKTLLNIAHASERKVYIVDNLNAFPLLKECLDDVKVLFSRIKANSSVIGFVEYNQALIISDEVIITIRKGNGYVQTI